MEKRKRWRQLLIATVLTLTLYNIFPTIFYYSKPLKSPIDERQSQQIALEISHRVDQLEKQALDWLRSFCRLIQVIPQSIAVSDDNLGQIFLTFKNAQDAHFFRKHLPKAGALISWVPSQLSLVPQGEGFSKTVIIQRKIPFRFDRVPQDRSCEIFQYSKKFDSSGAPTPLYQTLVFDRSLQLGLSIAGPSENALLLQAAINAPKGPKKRALVLQASQILASPLIKGQNPLSKRFMASFSQIATPNRSVFIESFLSSLTQVKDQIKLERINLQSEHQSLKSKGKFLETTKSRQLETLIDQETSLNKAADFLKQHKETFIKGESPWSRKNLMSSLEQGIILAQEKGLRTQRLSFEGSNPFIKGMVIDWMAEMITLELYPSLTAKQEERQSRDNTLDQAIYNEIAYLRRKTGESIQPARGQNGGDFAIKLNEIEGGQSFLTLNLSAVAQAYVDQLKHCLTTLWNPKHRDLKKEVFPLWDYATYSALPTHEQKLGLLLYSPTIESEPIEGTHPGSIYVIAKGLDKILQKIELHPNSVETKEFYTDFNDLQKILAHNGMFGYSGSTLTTNASLQEDFIFEGEKFYDPLLKATRESFQVRGMQRFAVLEFSNREQRILTQNRIGNQIHEELLKWRDNYHAAQLGIGGASPFDVPKPTQYPLWDNLKLSAKKYIQGDSRKVLNWGLDLSGGKTVQIELRDQNNRVVTDDSAIEQGINELHQRVNKMGVSEVAIRQEGNRITLDFPGSQEVSAQELIQSSTMYFHIVNEKFNERNPPLANAADQFLQEVWNEAVVTGRKSPEEINQIAWRHLHGDSLDPNVIQPRSSSGKILCENGLRLASPFEDIATNLFNDTLSKITLLRGEDFSNWKGKTHPLLIVFQNFAIEGSQLKNVLAGYDPNRGNFLNFEIRGKEVLPSGEKTNPREDLFSWTSQFSKDKIAGTPNASYSSEEGWRMAVVLNGSVITAPNLNAPIRDQGMIEGSFTQREVAKLEADLKAGSLSFTPHILSEKNISPQLGTKERIMGIGATAIALALVILCMIIYYRFGGLIASFAVIVNLLLMWGALQNLGATLTLASIAGAILTLGMAVDANVLIFERIREEFSKSKKIALAINAGYRKAFSSIIDSNITTTIAAFILLQFDSGPIKGFAITLIIGIASSMFTALFMTRTFFISWAQNPKHVQLKMLQIVKKTKYNFVKYGKKALLISAPIILLGSFLLVSQKGNIIGMDFTGGYSLSLTLAPSKQENYRERVEKALVAQGASLQDIRVRQLTPPNSIRLFLSYGMQQQGKPFYQMPLQASPSDPTHPYELNPRIAWVISSLEKGGLSLSPNSLPYIDQSWNEISGQLSDSMRKSAIVGLILAVITILIYITIRFEFKYAASATLCLIHDIAITLALIALINFCGLPIQIDLNTVAALMTIAGYSLNDTIIVFDRIREDTKTMRTSPFVDVLNHSLNVTLSRTLMTSGTTLFALLPLAFLGGSTLFTFSLVMIIGVVFGTLSSLFISTPLLKWFHERRREKREISLEIVRE